MWRYWYRFKRLVSHKVLHTDDPPHMIALGAAIATFVAFLPLVGIQTLLSVGLAALLRANKAICVPIVWISNPFTILPIYGSCLATGRLIVNAGGSEKEVVLAHLWPGSWVSFVDPVFWKGLLATLMGLGAELWVGCVVLGLVAAIAMYFISRAFVISHRQKRAMRIARRERRRAERRRRRLLHAREPVSS